MRLSVLFALTTTFALALSPLACGGADAEDPLDSSQPSEGESEDELKSLSLTEADNGKTVNMAKGQSLILKLGAQPSAGYKWQVTATDRTLGYPTETYLRSSAAVGASGLQKFTWKGSSTLNVVGKHKVTLEYKRAWEKKAAAKVFTFTVNVLDTTCPQLVPPGPGFCPTGQITPEKDEKSCTTGYVCKPDCRTTGCGAGSSCQGCWGRLACVSRGAMC